MTARAEVSPDRFDVLMCAGASDVPALMPYALKSCLKHLEPLRHVYVVSDVPAAVHVAIDRHNLTAFGVPIIVLDDAAALAPRMRTWPGWLKQQIIRLHSDLICASDTVVCVSADTILCRAIRRDDLFEDGAPILFYNRYIHTASHLEYERRRVVNIARLLQVTPNRSLPLGDFIMDLKLLERRHLQALRAYLITLYGSNPWDKIVPQRCETLEDKVRFGEWTLYAVFILDVLKANVPTRNSANRFIAQVHSLREFESFHFEAHVVHFVDKSLDLTRLAPWLEEWGLM